MDNSNDRIFNLLSQLEKNRLSDVEYAELLDLIRDDQNESSFISVLQKSLTGQQPGRVPTEQLNEIWDAIHQKVKFNSPSLTADLQSAVTTHRIHFLRTAWLRYAAAIIIMIGIGTWIYITNQKEKPSVATTSPVPVQNDVAPGGNRATLTLADGSKIVLDNANDGVIAEQGKIAIVKEKEKIIYNIPPSGEGVARSAGGGVVSYNTMTTPRGGQYQLTLPDGSQVWLNAESSITYPTTFGERERERRVSVTGEVYFEVTKDASKPFIVAVSRDRLSHPEQSEGSVSPAGGGGAAGTGGGLEIEVLGTHFNVNTYNDETTKNITLLEGAVRLTTHYSPLTKNAVLTLKPGQQGQLTENKLSLAANPDVEQVMAWKNGIFDFNDLHLRDVMKQLSRWYDVEVIYEGRVPDLAFGGKMGRDLNLSQVIKALGAMGVKFRIKEKKLIVTQ